MAVMRRATSSRPASATLPPWARSRRSISRSGSRTRARRRSTVASAAVDVVAMPRSYPVARSPSRPASKRDKCKRTCRERLGVLLQARAVARGCLVGAQSKAAGRPPRRSLALLGWHVVLVEMTEPRFPRADGVPQTTVGGPALDAEQLGDAEIEAVVRGGTVEVPREVPRALREPVRRSKRYRHGEEQVEAAAGRARVEILPDDHVTEGGHALEDEQARGNHLDPSGDPRAPQRSRPCASVLDDEQLERQAGVEAHHCSRHRPPPVPRAAPRSRIAS